MALVVFLRGINVGGHRRLRPSAVARELSAFDVVNIGAAGTFVVRRPGSQTKFRAELLRRLPFEAHAAVCDARYILSLVNRNPFAAEPPDPDLVRFAGVFAKPARALPSTPFTLPANGDWFVRVIASDSRFVCGVYRRHMKTIGYLGQLDALFGAPAAIRNWNTILAVLRILKAPHL